MRLMRCDVSGSLVIEMHSSSTRSGDVWCMFDTLRRLRCVMCFCCNGERGALHSSSLDSFVDLRYSMLALSGGGPSSLLVVVIAGARPVGALAVTVFDLAQISQQEADWHERTAAGGRSFSVINMSAKSALISSSSTYVPDFALAADG